MHLDAIASTRRQPGRVVCVGLVTADIIASVPAWPEPDGRTVVAPFARAGGGPAATAAVTIARLGGRPSFIGAVGDDEMGERARQELGEAGVDVRHLATVAGSRTSESIILVHRSTASRSIIHAPDAALRALDEGALGACRGAEWVHVDHAGYALVADLRRERLSVDAGNPIPRLSVDGLGLYAPTLNALRERYPGRPTADALRDALDEGARRVAVTLGSDGAVAADHSGAWRVAGVRTDIVSTLGAGDVFHGALLAALAAGRRLPEALRRANLAAALSCGAIDGRSAIPTPDELEWRLASAPQVEFLAQDAMA